MENCSILFSLNGVENCWEEAPQVSPDYYPHYDLFKSSIFYDTDNFRVSYLSYRYDDCSPTESGTRCCEEHEKSAEPPDKPAEAQPPDKPAEAQPPDKPAEAQPPNKPAEAEPPNKPAEAEPPNKPAEAEPPNKPAEAEPLDKPAVVEAEAAVTPPPEPPTPIIITKEELYRDPDLFECKNENAQALLQPEPPFLSDSQPWGYDWTTQKWVKADHDGLVVKQKGKRNENWKNKKKLYQQLVSTPRLPISKAETIMQKMGWRGGALGKTGEGIVEPVIPESQYSFAAQGGFARRTTPPPRLPPAGGRCSRRDAFRTNVLLHVLYFVRDDTEIELLFDCALRQHERRFIHTLVHNVINDQNVSALNSIAQYDLVDDICRCNQYELCTASDGEPPQRQLSIYKEAPEHVYLVTPDDFQPKTDDPANESEGSTENPKHDDSIKIYSTTAINEAQDTAGKDMDDDENPFLKSIKKSIKKDEPKSITNKFEKEVVEKFPSVEDKMVEFFLEFAEAEEYKELRFLGKFTPEQMGVVNDLLNDVATCIEDVDSFKGNKDILKVFKTGNVNLRLEEGLNGTTEIHKVPPEPSSKNIE